jgi:hypothetical protein
MDTTSGPNTLSGSDIQVRITPVVDSDSLVALNKHLNSVDDNVKKVVKSLSSVDTRSLMSVAEGASLASRAVDTLNISLNRTMMQQRVMGEGSAIASRQINSLYQGVNQNIEAIARMPIKSDTMSKILGVDNQAILDIKSRIDNVSKYITEKSAMIAKLYESGGTANAIRAQNALAKNSAPLLAGIQQDIGKIESEASYRQNIEGIKNTRTEIANLWQYQRNLGETQLSGINILDRYNKGLGQISSTMSTLNQEYSKGNMSAAVYSDRMSALSNEYEKMQRSASIAKSRQGYSDTMSGLGDLGLRANAISGMQGRTGKDEFTASAMYSTYKQGLTSVREAMIGLDMDLAKGNVSAAVHGQRMAELSKQYETFAVGAQRADQQLGRFTRTGNSMMNVLGKVTTWMVGTSVVLGTMGAAREGWKSYLEFQEQIADALRTGTDAQMSYNEKLMITNRLQREAIGYTSEHAATMKQATSVMYELTSSNMTFEQSMKMSAPILDLAVGTRASEIDLTRMLSQAYLNFGKQIKDTTDDQEKMYKLSGILAQVWKKQQFEVNDAIAATRYSLGSASLAGMPYEELIAAHGVVSTQGGQKGRVAGTGLTALLAESSKNIDKINKVFGTSFDKKKKIDFMELTGQLYGKYKNDALTFEQMATSFDLFGRQGARYLATIVKHYPEFKALVDQLKSMSPEQLKKVSQELRDIRESTVPAQLQIAKQNFNNMFIKGFSGLLGGSNDIETLKNLNKTLQGMQGDAEQFGKGLRSGFNIIKDILSPAGKLLNIFGLLPAKTMGWVTSLLLGYSLVNALAKSLAGMSIAGGIGNALSGFSGFRFSSKATNELIRFKEIGKELVGLAPMLFNPWTAGITALVVALVGGVYAWNKYQQAQKAAIKRSEELHIQHIEEHRQTSFLVNDYNEMRDKLSKLNPKTAEAVKLKKQMQEKMNAIGHAMPELIRGWNKEGNAIDFVTGYMIKLNDEMREWIRLRRQGMVTEMADRSIVKQRNSSEIDRLERELSFGKKPRAIDVSVFRPTKVTYGALTADEKRADAEKLRRLKEANKSIDIADKATLALSTTESLQEAYKTRRTGGVKPPPSSDDEPNGSWGPMPDTSKGSKKTQAEKVADIIKDYRETLANIAVMSQVNKLAGVDDYPQKEYQDARLELIKKLMGTGLNATQVSSITKSKLGGDVITNATTGVDAVRAENLTKYNNELVKSRNAAKALGKAFDEVSAAENRVNQLIQDGNDLNSTRVKNAQVELEKARLKYDVYKELNVSLKEAQGYDQTSEKAQLAINKYLRDRADLRKSDVDVLKSQIAAEEQLTQIRRKLLDIRRSDFDLAQSGLDINSEQQLSNLLGFIKSQQGMFRDEDIRKYRDELVKYINDMNRMADETPKAIRRAKVGFLVTGDISEYYSALMSAQQKVITDSMDEFSRENATEAQKQMYLAKARAGQVEYERLAREKLNIEIQKELFVSHDLYMRGGEAADFYASKISGIEKSISSLREAQGNGRDVTLELNNAFNELNTAKFKAHIEEAKKSITELYVDVLSGDKKMGDFFKEYFQTAFKGWMTNKLEGSSWIAKLAQLQGKATFRTPVAREAKDALDQGAVSVKQSVTDGFGIVLPQLNETLLNSAVGMSKTLSEQLMLTAQTMANILNGGITGSVASESAGGLAPSIMNSGSSLKTTATATNDLSGLGKYLTRSRVVNPIDRALNMMALKQAAQQDEEEDIIVDVVADRFKATGVDIPEKIGPREPSVTAPIHKNPSIYNGNEKKNETDKSKPKNKTIDYAMGAAGVAMGIASGNPVQAATSLLAMNPNNANNPWLAAFGVLGMFLGKKQEKEEPEYKPLRYRGAEGDAQFYPLQTSQYFSGRTAQQVNFNPAVKVYIGNEEFTGHIEVVAVNAVNNNVNDGYVRGVNY